MSLKDDIIEQLSKENPSLVITTDYLCNLCDLKGLQIEDIAYASVFDWVILGKEFKNIEHTEEINYTVYSETVEYDNIIEVDYLCCSYDLEEADRVALLFLTLYPSKTVNEVYFMYDYKVYYENGFDEDFLEEAWKYVIDNDLHHTKFAKAILKTGYKPPKSETYSHWLSKLSHRQLKSARKN